MDIVTRFCLAIVHCIFLHPHEGGIRISLAVAVAISKGLKLILVVFHFWGTFALHLLYGLAHLLVTEPRLIHLLEDAVCSLFHLIGSECLLLIGIFHCQS